MKLKDSDKEITCRKNILLINAIKPALKRLRVGGESEQDQLQGLVCLVSQTLFWFALINPQPQKIKRTTFPFQINKHACSSSKISKRRKHNTFKCEIPSLYLRQKAESVEMLGKGQTTNIFTIYFF